VTLNKKSNNSGETVFMKEVEDSKKMQRNTSSSEKQQAVPSLVCSSPRRGGEAEDTR
jgi:hypothetical protein